MVDLSIAFCMFTRPGKLQYDTHLKSSAGDETKSPSLGAVRLKEVQAKAPKKRWNHVQAMQKSMESAMEILSLSARLRLEL